MGRGWPITPAGMRALMLDFLGHLRARPVTRGRRTGQRLSPASVQRLASDVEQFYLFMTDNKDTAAAALAEPGWLRLGPEHAGFYRRGELPGKPRPRLDGQVIDDDAMTRIMGGLDLLGAAVADGGFGDEQAMRITMLVALLGRRVSEICLLDRDPLLPLSPTAPTSPGEPAADGDDQALVAKLRYQQTKIDGAPDTILVHAEVVAIIREQQQWAQRFFAEHGAPGRTPKYLFLAAQMNRNGDRPYSGNTLRNLLTDLAVRLDVRDSTGALVDFNRTHRFRPHRGHRLAEHRRPVACVAALPRAPDADHEHDLRADPAVHRRGRVPALPQDHRRWARDRGRPPRPLRHARVGPAHRPDPAQRVLPAASPSGLRQGQRLPDLRQVRHRRHLPARAARSSRPAPGNSSTSAARRSGPAPDRR